MEWKRVWTVSSIEALFMMSTQMHNNNNNYRHLIQFNPSNLCRRRIDAEKAFMTPVRDLLHCCRHPHFIRHLTIRHFRLLFHFFFFLARAFCKSLWECHHPPTTPYTSKNAAASIGGTPSYRRCPINYTNYYYICYDYTIYVYISFRNCNLSSSSHALLSHLFEYGEHAFCNGVSPVRWFRKPSPHANRWPGSVSALQNHVIWCVSHTYYVP